MSLRVVHYSGVENAYDEPERVGRLAGTIDALRDDRSVVVGTGDNTAPGVLALRTDGRQALDFFRDVDPVDPGTEYSVATTSFAVHHGRDVISPDRVLDSFGVQHDAIVEYARETGLDVKLDGRLRSA